MDWAPNRTNTWMRRGTRTIRAIWKICLVYPQLSAKITSPRYSGTFRTGCWERFQLTTTMTTSLTMTRVPLQKTVRLQRLVPFLFKIHPHLRVHQHFPARLPASKRSCCPVHFLASARSPVPGCTNRESVRKRAVKSKPRIELIEVTGERTDSPEELSVYLVGEWE